MALTYTEITLRGVTQDAIEIDSGDGTYILKNALADFDVKHLTAVEALITGPITTWGEALEAYTMPNGMTADVYYAPYIIDVEDANAAFRPAGVNKVVWDRLDDHEDRIVALEPTP